MELNCLVPGSNRQLPCWSVCPHFDIQRSVSCVALMFLSPSVRKQERKDWSHLHFTILRKDFYEEILRFPKCL